MDTKNDGGAAFPLEGQAWHPGMSLRDYFAAQAATGLCGNPGHGDFMLGKCNSSDPGAAYQQVATTAYRIADAMIKARGE